MKVEVVEYCSDWEIIFKKEAAEIQNILQDEIVAIHHIGSTAVPGLKAKPIIDILVVVKDIYKVDDFNELFSNIGYEVMGEFGISGRRYFRKGKDIRTHQIHIFEKSNQYAIDRHLAVRDYLRRHKDEAAAYGELKSKAALLHPQNIRDYSKRKDEFVKNLEKKALAWYKMND